MNTKELFFFTLFSLMAVSNVFAQTTKKSAFYFDNPIMVDSASTLIIPTRYNSEFLSSNKIALSGDFYANILFYNFNEDTYKPLFEQNTYIIGFSNHFRNNTKPQKNITSHWLLYKVKNIDRNKNGRIDENDPSILYVSDLQGNNLKPLTSENENVVGIEVFEKQNFALIKIQIDMNKDGNFGMKDKAYYFVRLDLKTLTFGNKIEISQ